MDRWVNSETNFVLPSGEAALSLLGAHFYQIYS